MVKTGKLLLVESTTITFLFDNASNSEVHRVYKTNRVLAPNDSIRETAISVINEAAENGVEVYDNGIHGDAEAISIYISSLDIKNVHDGWEKSGFGLRYSLNEDGAVRFLNNYDPLRHDWTLSELNEIVAAGYIDGDITTIIVGRPIGLGAAAEEIFDWLGFISDTFNIVVSVGGVGVITKNFFENLKIRKIVKAWKKNGMKYPQQLRDFIDTKGGWKLDEVKKRLKVDDEHAIKLLQALGLEPKGNEWRLTHSKQSIRNRKNWIRNEKKYTKSNKDTL